MVAIKLGMLLTKQEEAQDVAITLLIYDTVHAEDWQPMSTVESGAIQMNQLLKLQSARLMKPAFIVDSRGTALGLADANELNVRIQILDGTYTTATKTEEVTTEAVTGTEEDMTEVARETTEAKVDRDFVAWVRHMYERTVATITPERFAGILRLLQTSERPKVWAAVESRAQTRLAMRAEELRKRELRDWEARMQFAFLMEPMYQHLTV